MHPEEALDGVAVLHGGAPVAVDEGARLLARHAGAVGDLLLGVLAAVGLEPGAAQQVEALQEACLEIGFTGRAAVSRALDHGPGTPEATDSRWTSKTSACGTPSRSASAVTRATTAGSRTVAVAPGTSKPSVTDRSPSSRGVTPHTCGCPESSGFRTHIQVSPQLWPISAVNGTECHDS